MDNAAPHLSRRWATSSLFALGSLAAVGGLTGCGFRLRGSGVSLAFKSIELRGSGSVALVQQLQDQLRASGVDVVMPQPAAQSIPPMVPDVILTLLQDQRERVVVGTAVAGQVRELQLRHTVRFHLRTPTGKELIEEAALQQVRELSYSETQALAKQAEEALLFDDMRSGVVRQIMTRLAAVRSL
jgi:LPS-assembly lipoprotein